MKLTALLLNWKRPHNLPEVISSVRSQTVPVDIWLWNNNPDDKAQYDVDMRIDSPRNFKCWPRWLLASLVDGGCIFTLDDDIMMSRNTFLEECVTIHNILHKIDTTSIIGYSGVILNQGLSYWDSLHVHEPKPSEDIPVHIVKGRFMFMQSSLLKQISLEGEMTCEDIKVSSRSRLKLLPSALAGGLQDLAEGSNALHQDPTQRNKRALAALRYFSHHD
jgi:hypothetical protein